MSITKCSNEKCPKAKNCYRKTKPNEDYQQYAPYFFEVVEGDQAVCRDFWPDYNMRKVPTSFESYDLWEPVSTSFIHRILTVAIVIIAVVSVGAVIYMEVTS